jgi:hypothetical protein
MLPQLHIPPSNIVKGYTNGQEYITSKTLEEYIGMYHVYPNGAIYSNASYSNDSVELVKLPAHYFNDPNIILYRARTARVYDKYILPTYYFPKPTAKEIETGVMQRFICQKRNELSNILEIDKTQASMANMSNRRGIDLNIWKLVPVEWTIRGPEQAVEAANRRVLSVAERKMPGITTFLYDLLEFYA